MNLVTYLISKSPAESATEEQERWWVRFHRVRPHRLHAQFLGEHLKKERLSCVQEEVVAGKHPQREGSTRLIAPGFEIAIGSLCDPASRQRRRWGS